MNVLTINAGSSSLKYKFFSINNNCSTVILAGLIEGIGEQEGNWHHTLDKKTSTPHQFASHHEAFLAFVQKLSSDIGDLTIDAVGHRVVHGGSRYFNPTVITQEVLQAIVDLSQLAPIHNPINALGIQFAMQYFTNAVQVAIFDSGFHHTLPTHVYTYAIDTAVANHYQIRRYGFHGINHEYVSQQAANFLKKPLGDCNFISLHLGNGASACLVKDGKSVDISMGMTPLAGLIMGTRCGDVDPAIPLYLQQQGMPLNEVDTLLNKKSGLLGIAKDNDMRRLLTRMDAGDETATLAIAMYVHSILKTIGGYIAQTPALDALIFTGGVGENAHPIRAKILAPLEHLGLAICVKKNQINSIENCRDISPKGTPILVIRGDEEEFIAHEVVKIIKSRA